jgi:hypothetical protein
MWRVFNGQGIKLSFSLHFAKGKRTQIVSEAK